VSGFSDRDRDVLMRVNNWRTSLVVYNSRRHCVSDYSDTCSVELSLAADSVLYVHATTTKVS